MSWGHPELCDSWTSHHDITGEGQQTFYHECNQPAGHDGRHTCMGHFEPYAEGLDKCHESWKNFQR